jgi:signal transduction histidine kinase
MEETSVFNDAKSLLSAYRRASDFQAAIAFDGRIHATSETVSDPADIPESLRNVGDQISYERTLIDDRPYLVVGQAVEGTEARLFFYFSEGSLQRIVSEFGGVLLTGWLVIVAVSGIVGILLAKRIMAPVTRASDAAHSLAEGLLDTRLPVESYDEFGVLAMSFNEMAQALEQKITELFEARERERRFTANVAHELKTPVAALVSEASLARELMDDVPIDMRRPMELLIDDVTRLRQLIEDLMEISLFDAGRQTLEIDDVDVRSILTSMLRRRGWDASVAVDAEPVVLRTDRRRLELIIANLVGNAIKHGQRGVATKIRRVDEKAIIEVVDEGSGIPEERLPHLFDRFYKGDPAHAGSGSGLGLSLVLENARLMGADIDVKSEIGRGSRFTVILPLELNPMGPPSQGGAPHTPRAPLPAV